MISDDALVTASASAPVDWFASLPPLPDDPRVLACRFLPDTTLVQVNAAYAAAFGEEPEALIGRPFLDLVPESEHETIRKKLDGLTPRSPTQTYHHQAQAADGVTVVQQWRDRALFDANHQQGLVPVGFESTGRDLSTLEHAQAALLESEERFQSIADYLHEVFWSFDPMKQKFTYVSPAALEVLALTPGEVYDNADCWFEAVHPDDRSAVSTAMLRSHEQDFSLTYRTVDADGLPRMLRTRATPTGDGLAVGMTADVTVEQQSFEMAVRNEQRFRALLAGSLDAVYLLEAFREDDGEITDFVFAEVNEPACKLISRSRDEIIGQKLCELLPVNRTHGFFERYKRIVEIREPFMDEFAIEAQDQGVVASWLQHHVIPVGDGVAIAVRDTTQRKRDELEIARLYEQTQTILDAVPSFIFYKDPHNRILRVNRAAAESMGHPVEAIEGRNTEEFFPEDAAAYYRDDVEVMNSGQPKLGYIERFQVPGQGKKYIQTDKVPMYDDQGQPIGILAVATDVTERRKAEIERDELEMALEERRLIGHELHDGIGQQLTGLRMLIQSARQACARGDRVDASTFDELGGIIADATDEVRRLINGLLPERVSPDELVAALGRLCQRLRVQYDLEVIEDLDIETQALCDVLNADQAEHFLMIAHEATHNAAKHAGATTLQVRLLLDEKSLMIEVLDDGRGIPENRETSATSGKGLTIMRHRADMVDATLAISRRDPAGTVVRCVKPLDGTQS